MSDLAAAVDRFRGRVDEVHRAKRRAEHGNTGRKMLSLEERRVRDEQIRALRAEGRSLDEIATRFGITRSRVSQIADRATA